MHILLLEPDKILAGVYKAALEQAGHSISLSHHAQQAVFAADQKAPDLVILEMQLPGHSGIEFLYEFRSYPEWQNVPVITHTLVDPDNLKIQAFQLSQLGVVKYLYKPTTTLTQLVQNIGQELQTA